MEVTHDIFAVRYGGEEFIVFIQGQRPERVTEMSKEIQNRIADLRISHISSHVSDVVMVSIGESYCGEAAGQQVYEIISKADEALYEAKRKGRNQIFSRHYHAGYGTIPLGI